MSTGLSGPQISAVAARHYQAAPLVELAFDAGSLFLTTAPFDIPIGSDTYLSAAGLGSIDALGKSVGATEGMRFSLSGISQALVTIATAEPYQGRMVYVRKGYFDPSTNALIDSPVLVWVGRMRTMQIVEQNDSASITVTAEHFEADLARAMPVRMNNADQQRLYPGDRGFEYVESLVERVVVWPSKEALKK